MEALFSLSPVKQRLSALLVLCLIQVLRVPCLFAQQPEMPAPKAPPAAAQAPNAENAPEPLTLPQALALARQNSPQFQAAVTAASLAREDRTQARNALLPSASYENSALYTQGTPALAQAAGANSVLFIANNAVHEYISQANVHEAIDVAAVANWRRVSAAAAVARAQQEVAARGLVVTVVQSFYNVAAAQQKLQAARLASEEGDTFLKITEGLEKGGEVAHADVVKAELQTRDRQRALQEAELALLNARLDLAVLIFRDFRDNFEIVDDLHAPAALPSLEEFQQLAARDNPDVQAALAATRQADNDVLAARAGYLPSLSLDYFYGIDSPQFAVNGTVGGQKFSNLGSSIVGSLNVPVWNWGTTQSRVKQANLRRDQAKRELSLAQRTLLAQMRSLYAEANTSLAELEGLHRSTELAAESLRLTTLRYKNGESTVLEVVDAQNAFSQANNAYQDGAVRYRVARAKLQTLTGAMTP